MKISGIKSISICLNKADNSLWNAIKQTTSWIPGTKRPEHPLHDAFRLFEIEFTDSDDTVIIIDEIQESAEIYNRIREFTRQFKSHFIITGSYPGKIYESDFRYSSGDVTTIPIYTLSFEEFLLAYDSALYEQYQDLSLDTPDSGNVYTLLKEAYDIYCQIGGYPGF